MTMKFYDALQMDPAVLKREIAACDTKQEKAYYWVAMAVRSAQMVRPKLEFSMLQPVYTVPSSHSSAAPTGK